MKLQPGQQVGAYTVIQELGHGGMSDVFLAQDPQHAREVVLKFPHDDMMGDPSTYERFCREVKIGNALTHPNIQKLYELAGETNAPFLVLEYVPGRTLRDVLSRTDKHGHGMAHSVEETVSLGTQVGRALSYAHENHVFHRDMKPENIIVTPEGQAKVMDFGIAFVEGARRVTWGRMSSQVGTPDYMAPEQIKGQRGNHRTDIYALGMILYEYVAGRLPYQGDNSLAVMNQHVTVSPPPLHHFCPEVPPALEEVIMKAIRRNMEARWQTVQELVDALEHLDQVDAGVLRAERETTETDGPSLGGTVGELNMHPWQLAAIILGALLLLAGIGIIAQLLHTHR